MAHRGRNSIARGDKKKNKTHKHFSVHLLSIVIKKPQCFSVFFPQKVLYVFLCTYSVNKHKLQSWDGKAVFCRSSEHLCALLCLENTLSCSQKKETYQSRINILPVCLMLPFTTALFQMLRPISKHTEINRQERLMLVKIGNQFWIWPLEESYHCKEKLNLLIFLIQSQVGLHNLGCFSNRLCFALCLVFSVVQFRVL